MRILIALACALAVAAAALVPAASGGAGSGLVLAPPPGGRIYRAAFPDFGGAEQGVSAGKIASFERASGEPITWAYFSNNWDKGIEFPTANVEEIRAAGRVPFIRMMPRTSFSEGHADPTYTMQSFLDGRWDSDLRRWCDGAAAVDGPLLVEFGTEVNGDWFPWNGRWNGGGRTDGYGDPSVPDGPERFRDVYRRIVDTCNAQGADNITWFWHVDVGASPEAKWNSTYANYYPGERYVDWIGISDYGPLVPSDGWESFRHRLDAVYPELDRLAQPGDKPIAVLEYGAREDRGHRRKARWIRHAIDDVASHRWPRIAALSYWHERWKNGNGTASNLHIDSSKRALRAYRRAISKRTFTSTPTFRQR
jgi:Glycosyl hydrolase family 26